MQHLALGLALLVQLQAPAAPTPAAPAPAASAVPAAPAAPAPTESAPQPPAAPAASEAPAAPPTAEPAPALPPAEEKKSLLPPKTKPRLLVMDFADKGAGPDITSAINQAVQGQAVTSHAGETVTATQIKILLDAQASQQLVGCDTELCMTDIGKLIEADVILGGNVSKVGDDVVITVLTVNPTDGTRITQEQRKTPVNRDLYYYAAKQLASLVLTGKAADTRVPVVIRAFDKQGTGVEVKVIIDGKQLATATTHQVELDPGQHELMLQRDGYVDWKSVIDVAEATPVLVNARLIESRIPLWPVAVATGVAAVGLGVTAALMGDYARDRFDGSGLLGWGETQKDGTFVAFDRDNSYSAVTPTNSADLCQRELEISFYAGRAAGEGESFMGSQNECGVATGPGLIHWTAGAAGVFVLATGAFIATDLILAAPEE